VIIVKIGNLITVTGVEEVMWNPPKNKSLSYNEIKSDIIAEWVSGVKIEAVVLPWISAFVEEFVRLSYEYGVTLQSVVDNFTKELLSGKNPETSFFIVKEKLESPCIYQLAEFSEREEKPWPRENTLKT
jgi:hypothetical protein